MQKRSKRLLAIGIIIVVLLIWSFKIFIPAYLSYSASCKPEVFEEINRTIDGELVIEGQFVVSDKGDTSIEIFTQDINVLKHELVHYNQFKDNRLWSCENALFRYFNEAEAYTFENVPYSLFCKMYDCLE